MIDQKHQTIIKESTLLYQIKIIPVVLLIISFILSTKLIIDKHHKHLEKEISYIKEHFTDLQKEIIKKEVTKVYNLVEFISNKELPMLKDLNQEEIKKNMLQRIESMRYDQDGYIFIFDYEGNALININKSLTEENQLNLKDKNGFLLTQEIIKIAKKGDGYISYMGLEGTHKDQSRKISYIKGFQKWNWAIGYGFHPSNIQPLIDKKTKELNKKHDDIVKNLIGINTIVAIVFVILLMWFAKNFETIFNKYKKEIEKKEENNRQKDEIIFYQSKMASMGELINMISHQWRHPLSQINSLTMELYIKQKNEQLSTKNLKEGIKNIENTTRHLSNTIDDFSRFFINEKEKTDFLTDKGVDECIKLLKPSLKDIELELNYNSKKTVHGNITLYQQVLLTIITNSMDMFILRNIDNPKITINTFDHDNKSYVQILDNAKGIEDKYLDKIFDLYFSTKSGERVKGLGLYIAKKIIDTNMNGSIEAENFENGVKFTIKV